MPLSLPDVTVVVLDCVAHDLTRLALQDTLKQITPREVLTFSDQRLLPPDNAIWYKSNHRSYEAVAHCLWNYVPWQVRTTHFLVIQWDGWVIDAERWSNHWLDVDYVGAPWGWYGDDFKVGNGGFSLRSTAMTRYVTTRRDIRVSHPEDDALCRKYRPELEKAGWKWASERSARGFAFERDLPLRGTFGFHGLWNWRAILDEDRLNERISLCNDYVRAKPEWAEIDNVIQLRAQA